MKKQKSFFEIYANEYDDLTDIKNRKKNHSKEINTLINIFEPQSVLDAGCATGLTTSLFAQAGIKTKGIDHSRPMIKIAKNNYDKLANTSFQSASFEKLPKSFNNKYDLIVCLANAISGVGSLRNLALSFKSFYNSLKPGGTLVLQMLNYISIAEGELVPIRATQNGNIIYQRFSERRGKCLSVYVNRIDTSKKELKYEMFRHEFDNFTPQEVLKTLKKTKFSNSKKYSNLFLDKKFVKSSKDLVITAQKS